MLFTKMQGMGNDYVVIQAARDSQYEWSRMAITLLDRHFAIGGDSLLVILPSDKADVRMRIFDTDGSEAEACGNGIRCLARYVIDKGVIGGQPARILVDTLAGVREINLRYQGDKLVSIQANMGAPRFKPEEIPATVPQNGKILKYQTRLDSMELLLNLVSMGNPHAVYFWEKPVAEFPLSELGPKVENLAVFPNRVNFEVARVLSPKQIEARVWERGVGETLACGTGACAITALAQSLGYIESKVDIKLKGGVLEVETNQAGEMLLSGPAEIVFEGEWTKEV